MKRTSTSLLLALLLVLVAIGCSDGDDDAPAGGATTTAPSGGDDSTGEGDDMEGEDADPDPDGDDDGGGDGGDPGGAVEEMSTGGLIEYLEEEHPDENFAGEVSLLSSVRGSVRLGTQTSFFEEDEAVAFCEAASEYIYGVAGEPEDSAIELVATSGADLASRASADAPCEPGEDV